MEYRILGKTGLRVSQLGFGAMRLPMTGEGSDSRVDRALAIPMIHRAFEAGVNYIDTAVGYCNSDSQRVVGEALKGWRDKIIVSTKNPYYGDQEKDWWKNLEDSLDRLGTDHIDIYNHHGISWESYVKDVEPRMGKWMQAAQEQKLIRHVCVSFHDDAEGLKKLVDSGYAAVITLQYNMLDRSLEEGIAYAAKKGVGIVAMGPVAGGRLGVDTEVLAQLVPGVRRGPELALRFVLANAHVAVALSGMTTMAHVEENIATANDKVALSADDARAVDGHLVRLAKMAELYCTGCGYCLPCPKDVAIAKIFSRYNRGRVYGFWDSACEAYAAIGTNEWDKGAKADACVECGECEKKCPQHLPIMAQLKEAHTRLASPGK